MSSRTLRALLFVAAIIALLAVVWATTRGERTPPLEAGGTNVVLVIVDTLRADHVGAYGYDKPTTPNVDQLAERGFVFEQAVANCSWTRPSIASMLTGTWPRETGVYKEQFDALSPEVVTLAEMFQARGHATYGVTSNPSINEVFGFARGFDQYGDCGVVWPWMKGKNRYKKDVVLMEDADLVTDRAIEVLERHQGGPFYLQVLYIDPHLPYGAPENFDHPLVRTARTPGERYDGEIAFADEHVGRLVSWIDARYPDTMYVFTSDHGEGLRDHPGVSRSATHGFTLYDSNLLVPLIVTHPSVQVGERFGGMVQLLDLLPTLADLFGLELDAQVKGVSLAPILRGEDPPQLATQVFSETQFNEVDKLSVREQGWKFVISRDHEQLMAGERPDLDKKKRRSVRRAIEQAGPRELYRLPGSENPVKGDVNLAAGGPAEEGREVTDEERAERLRLESALLEWERTTLARPPINRDARKEVDSTVVEQLRALGYLE